MNLLKVSEKTSERTLKFSGVSGVFSLNNQTLQWRSPSNKNNVPLLVYMIICIKNICLTPRYINDAEPQFVDTIPFFLLKQPPARRSALSTYLLTHIVLFPRLHTTFQSVNFSTSSLRRICHSLWIHLSKVQLVSSRQSSSGILQIVSISFL